MTRMKRTVASWFRKGMLFSFDKKAYGLILKTAVIVAAAFFAVHLPEAYASENATSASQPENASGSAVKKKSFKIKAFTAEGDLVEVDTGVTRSAIEDSVLTASWKLTGFKDDGKTEISIYADTDNKGYDGDLIYSGTGEKSGSAILLAGDLATDDYYFYIEATRNGVTKRKYTGKSFPLVNYEDILPDCSVSFNNEEEITNDDVLAADVSFDGHCTVTALVNDNKVIDASGAVGRYNIPLSEGENSVELIVTGENGKGRHFTEDITLDTDPPYLLVSTDVDGAVTSAETVDISGNVEKGALLTVNDETILYDSDGNFSTTVKLDNGNNIVDVKAEDEAGNINNYPMTVYRRQIRQNKRNKKAAIFVGGLFGIIIFGYIFFFIKWIRKHRRLDKKKNRK